jgi:hypothetical protein
MPTGNIVTLDPGRELKVKDGPVAGDRKRLLELPPLNRTRGRLRLAANELTR